MKKTAVSCLALGVCLVAFGSYFGPPILREHTPRSTPDPNDRKLAVLAPVSTAPATEEPSPQAQEPPTLYITVTGHTVADEPAKGVVLSPTQDALFAPAMAPAISALLLPTITPTPQPVIAVAQSRSLAVEVSSSSSAGCTVTSPPVSLALDPTYTKYCSALGIPIVSSDAVPDAALQRAWEIVSQMLSGILQADEIRTSIVGLSTRIGIVGVHQLPTDMPEHRSLYTLFPGVDWNTRARGMAATPDIPLLSIAEENLLCYPNDLWIGQNVLVHEFAHTIKNMGLEYVNPAFHAELQRTYQHALDAGLWPGTYVISDVEEYWAEGVRLYFQSDPAGVPGGQAYPANSRAELQSYDPDLYRLIENIFGTRSPISPCPFP